jgi:zearalenone synthase (highly reducing iterative type I polyketide synthase)
VIKGVLALENGLIPPNILFNTPNPKIQFQKWKVAVPTTLTPWPSDGVRRMSVNSFGAGGTNAHAVLDGAEHYLRERGSQLARISDRNIGVSKEGLSSPRLLMISSHDQDGLARQRESLAKFIQTQANNISKPKQDNYLHRLAYTLSERRSALPWKSFAVASNLEDLALVHLAGPANHPDSASSSPDKERNGHAWEWSYDSTMSFSPLLKAQSLSSSCS